MIRLLKETTWVEAHAGCGSLAGAREHEGKLYIPVVKERLQYYVRTDSTPSGAVVEVWADVPTVERRRAHPGQTPWPDA